MPSEAPAENLTGVKKIVTGLQVGDRRARKQALKDLEQFITNSVNFTDQDLRNFFVETHIYTLNCFRDSTEAVREQAVKFMTFLIIDKLPLNDFYLTYIFPVIVERIGSPEIIEESEELRLELVKFLQSIILKYSNTEQLKPFLNDCIIILQESIKDKHPAVKEVSCDCVIDLSQALPREFHMQAEPLAKPLISCFCHQRFKVRVKAVNALGEVILNSAYTVLNDSVGPLAEKLFDQIPVVRRTVAQVAARLLTEYRDRYSFFHKILPLLLTGLNDEIEETRLESQNLWQQVGLQFQQENEKDLKDQLDYALKPPNYYPTHLQRPNLGCRTLVQRNVSKLTKALAFELTSWQPDVRFRCSQLLCSLTLHAERNIIQNLQELLPAMYSAARDEDFRVVSNIMQASEYIGLFVPVKTWCQLILPVLDDSVHFGHIIVLGSLIKGCPKEYLTDYLGEIAENLADDMVCVTRKKNLQRELIKCVNKIMEKYISGGEHKTDIGYSLFKIVITIYSIRDAENVDFIEITLLDDLYKVLKLDDRYNLWKKYTDPLLNHLKKVSESRLWTVLTTSACMFETIILESNQAFGDNLNLIKAILTDALNLDADAETRLKILYSLSLVFEKKNVIFAGQEVETIAKFLSDLIVDVFVPSLVWHAGLTAEALRTMTLSCLLSSLTPVTGVELFPNSSSLQELLKQLWPLLISSLEDASFRTRQLSLQCIVVLKNHACRHDIWTLEDFVFIYPEFLKRLDDPTDRVRLCALELLGEGGLFAEVPVDFKAANFKAHHELIVDTLMTHFDDEDDRVKSYVFAAVKVVAEINCGEVGEKVKRHRPLVRNRQGCDEILEFLARMDVK